MPAKKIFDIIYSIGDSCAVALYLKQFCTRATSGPFDWIGNGTFKERTNTICNHFDGFLDYDSMAEITSGKYYISNGKHTHERFICQQSGYAFIHDFELNQPLEVSFPSVKEKYSRRINRMLQALKTKKCLLVWFSMEHQTSDEEILEQSQKLNNLFGQCIHLLVIEHDEQIPIGDIQYKQLNGHIERYTLYAKEYDKQGNLKTKGNKELLNSIFSQYDLPNSAALRRKKAIKVFIVRLSTSLLPIKSLRKKLRKKYTPSNAEGD